MTVRGPSLGSVTPVTEDRIREMVHRFYTAVRTDSELGPIFDRRIGGDWPDHLEKMCRFWSTVLLGARSYRGDPMTAHLGVSEIEPHHFDRWLELFAETLHEIYDPATAQSVFVRAERMRSALQTAIERRRAGRTDLWDRACEHR